MTRALNTQAAARLASVSVRTIRSWCRHGIIAATKLHGRWTVALSSLLRRLNSRRPATSDRLRKGVSAPVKTGRAARVRVGHHMSVARRHAVLDAHIGRVNAAAGVITAAGYLTDVLGASAAFVAAYAPPFGTAVAKAYREQFDAEPRRDGLSRRGLRLFSCFAYRANEAAVLEAGVRSYRRTAELLAV